MKIIGVTGGIGSGKSTICKIFKTLGTPVFDADFQAKQLYLRDDVKSEILHQFGENVLDSSNNINLKKIAATVFTNPIKLSELNDILYPKLKVVFETWCNGHNKHKYVVKEAAVMIESGTYIDCDEIILVTSPIDLRIKRVMKRNNTNIEDIQNRIENQMSDEQRSAFCKYSITNDEKSFVINQVLNLHNIFHT